VRSPTGNIRTAETSNRLGSLGMFQIDDFSLLLVFVH
jgi:hypothetical protein